MILKKAHALKFGPEGFEINGKTPSKLSGLWINQFWVFSINTKI